MIKINRPWLPLVSEIEGDLERIFSSGIITSGPYVEKFEERLSAFLLALILLIKLT